ncbi:protein of unknown function DUF58 [Solidesulfovibrio fructosivorans JJ]]|uniref:VWFA domain-containing protein n=1 Tax=Solidesulfovibrio fructosivorans JJ] TaxID=596151 RepID=E1JTI9_SOLFR|nr:DUF58 domain-containing protein [Solidesulfovibrio fructosivorans]EFL52449.1 protein of unknown function DUF58 [Solidesulfovibrio fructosivorans JJ]]
MQAWQLLAAARRVRLRGHAPATEAATGGYRSAFRGAGLEFEEFREYAPGDDASSIDWKVTARLGRPFVKRYREERARTVMLAVDASPSMRASSDAPSPFFSAALAAVTLAVSAADSRDRVGLIVFSDRVETFVPPGKGRGQPHAVAAALAGAAPAGVGTDPRPALDLLAAVMRRRCVLFVFTDAFGADFAPALGPFAARHEVTLGLLRGGRSAVLPPYGLLRLAEAETGRHAVVDCGNARARERYARAVRERDAALRAGLAAAGVGVLELAVGDAPGPALDAYFRRRARPGAFLG